MKKNALIWILRRIRRRIPALTCLVAAEVGYALFCVYFALMVQFYQLGRIVFQS